MGSVISNKRSFFITLALLSLVIGCSNKTGSAQEYLAGALPIEAPLPIFPEILEEDAIIHKGIFSNDLQTYYFTVSDRSFIRFDVKVIQREKDGWSRPTAAPFNSSYSDHGMSFSPDGNTIYFSSTRPVDSTYTVAETWHLWRCHFDGNEWSKAEYVDIPNLRDKLTSHPTMTTDGKLFFHASEPDYSQMDLYVATSENDAFGSAEKVFADSVPRCTPFVAPDGGYLLFAAIESHLTLMISYADTEGWSTPKPLPALINSKGQGNPSVTPDGQFLLYTSAQDEWKVNWISTAKANIKP